MKPDDRPLQQKPLHGAGVPALRVYAWSRRFLLQADSLTLGASPHKRLSATLMIATRQPFSLRIGNGATTEHHALLLAPNVVRTEFAATNSGLTILDAGIDTPACWRLRTRLRDGGVYVLRLSELAALRKRLGSAAQDLSCSDASALYEDLVNALAPAPAPAQSERLDARVERIMAQLQEMPVAALSTLAREAGLSASHLRSLFQRDLGCSPAQYARWARVWNAFDAWTRDTRLTDLALNAGFHDLAHIDHAVKELFGMTPSHIIGAGGVHVRRCG